MSGLSQQGQLSGMLILVMVSQLNISIIHETLQHIKFKFCLAGAVVLASPVLGRVP